MTLYNGTVVELSSRKIEKIFWTKNSGNSVKTSLPNVQSWLQVREQGEGEATANKGKALEHLKLVAHIWPMVYISFLRTAHGVLVSFIIALCHDFISET